MPKTFRLSLAFRCVAIATVAVVLFVFFFHPFLPYSLRGELSAMWWFFPATALICGFLLTLGLNKRPFYVPTYFLLTLFAANFCLIVADQFREALDRHNLAPIEFIFIAVLASPAYLGTLFAVLIQARIADRRAPLLDEQRIETSEMN